MEPEQPLDYVESDPDRDAKPLVLLLEHLQRLHDFLQDHHQLVGVQQNLFIGKEHQLGKMMLSSEIWNLVFVLRSLALSQLQVLNWDYKRAALLELYLQFLVERFS